jgi:hypothetical protein
LHSNWIIASEAANAAASINAIANPASRWRNSACAHFAHFWRFRQ